jgi:hypothetical protein
MELLLLVVFGVVAFLWFCGGMALMVFVTWWFLRGAAWYANASLGPSTVRVRR